MNKECDNTINELKQKAKKGDVSSAFKLGLKYAKGEGVEKNQENACYWYEIASNLGHKNATFYLAKRYMNGNGRQKDEGRAIDFFNSIWYTENKERVEIGVDSLSYEAAFLEGILRLKNHDRSETTENCFYHASHNGIIIAHILDGILEKNPRKLILSTQELFIQNLLQYKTPIKHIQLLKKYGLPKILDDELKELSSDEDFKYLCSLRALLNLVFNDDFINENIIDIHELKDELKSIANKDIVSALLLFLEEYLYLKGKYGDKISKEKYNSINEINKLYFDTFEKGNFSQNYDEWFVNTILSHKDNIVIDIGKQIEIMEKTALQDKMQKLVEQFTHTLGNVIFPDTIYQVAERIKNLPNSRRDALLLHEAYHSEIIIKLQAELLRQRYSNTNPEKFKSMIRSCRRNTNSSDKIKAIEAILNYAFSRVTARFLNQHYAALESIRNKILSQNDTDLNQLKLKFEDDILLMNALTPIEWVNKNIRPIQITEISPLWKEVFILEDSHADALLFGYFSEILFNAFKYADHDQKSFLTLSFTEQNINDTVYLSCRWSNPTKAQNQAAALGTNKGLDAITEDLKQINDTEKPEESLLICKKNNQFQVTLFFKKELLIDDIPILIRKRKPRGNNHA